jgi:HSP20 family protein
MYSGTANKKDFPVRQSQALHFKETEDGKNIISPALVIPSVNISESPTEYLIVMATPGLQREDFCIEIDQMVITILAKKETIPLSSINDRCEYDYTDWTRAFALPDDADALLSSAAYQNGELIIHIPRSDTSENQAKATIYVY